MKLSKSELKEFKDQEQQKQAILHDLGLLATQSHTLSHMFAELAMKQEQSKKELEAKYGNIEVNLEDGTFKLITDEKNK
jgi:hypothetical protein|tara:strand:+ start:298 stop:534 length:237 start_codon:yes stop_codon:yes gene_type:complete